MTGQSDIQRSFGDRIAQAKLPSAWDMWALGCNIHLCAIDDWFGKYEGRLKFALEEHERALLKQHIRTLSEQIAKCPKPGNEAYAPGRHIYDEMVDKGTVSPAPAFPPVYAVGDEAVRRIDAGLSDRAKQRRLAAAAETYLFILIVAVGAFAVGWWLFDFIRG